MSYHKQDEYIDTDYINSQLMILQRYAISRGYVSSKYTISKLYNFFTKEVGILSKKKRSVDYKTRWLFKITRFLKDHEHEDISLKGRFKS